MNPHARFERALVGAEAAKGRQQGRVDIEHAPAPARHQPGREEPHESGQAHDLDAVGFEHRLHRAFERLPVVAVYGMINDGGRDPLGLGAAERGSPRAIG
jgi:hypothetical protein